MFKKLVRMDNALNNLPQLLSFIGNRPVNRSVWSILQRLVLGAMVYFIWQERNLRFFQEKRRPLNELFKLIKETVRLRMMSLKVRNSKQAIEVAELWDFL